MRSGCFFTNMCCFLQLVSLILGAICFFMPTNIENLKLMVGAYFLYNFFRDITL